MLTHPKRLYRRAKMIRVQEKWRQLDDIGEKNVTSDTFLGLNRNPGPHLCHFQLQSRGEALFPYEVIFSVWELSTADFDAVRARYAWNSSLFHYLHMFCKKNSFWSWCGDLFGSPLCTCGACKDPARVEGPTRGESFIMSRVHAYLWQKCHVCREK